MKKTNRMTAAMRVKTTLAVLFFVLGAGILSGAENRNVPPVVDLEGNTKYTVVIDPGHGGGDWGATIKGIHEKDITLRVAGLVKEKIEASEQDINIYMTREEDDFVRIEDRVGFSNNKKADVFITLHCDFISAQKSEGYKIYYMSGEPLALPEPGEGEENKAGVILWKEIQRYHINESLELAGYVSQYMQAALIPEESSLTGNDANDMVPFMSRKEAGIKSYILEGVNAPAVQLEMANMNYKRDLALLRDDKVLNQVAYHIKEGIVHYLKDKNMEDSE